MAFSTTPLVARNIPVDYRGSIMPVHKFRYTHKCVLRSNEVVHSLLYIKYWKNTQNADENKVELLN